MPPVRRNIQAALFGTVAVVNGIVAVVTEEGLGEFDFAARSYA
jgi:hypothetical protein